MIGYAVGILAACGFDLRAAHGAQIEGEGELGELRALGGIRPELHHGKRAELRQGVGGRRDGRQPVLELVHVDEDEDGLAECREREVAEHRSAIEGRIRLADRRDRLGRSQGASQRC